MPLPQPRLPLVRILASNRIPVVRQHKLHVQTELLGGIDNLVQFRKAIGVFIEGELAVFDELEPDGIV
jgi:hypothetical protein